MKLLIALTKVLHMKKLLLVFFSFFYLSSFSQVELNIYDSYLQELVLANESRSVFDFDSGNLEWRKNVVQKITSISYMDPSFLKTAMVLNMLKYKLGDNIYKEAIYELNKQEEEISVLNLKQTFEVISQEDLSDFFDDWFVGKGYPSYEVSWFQNEKTHVVNFLVLQLQSDPSVSFFEMPLPIKVSNDQGESQIIRLEISNNKQTFTGYIPFNITQVEVDPEHQIISTNNIVKNGVDQDILNTSISLFPNPAKNFINIQNSGEAVVEKVSIFNMLGKLVMEETNPISAIDLKPLSFGIHLVKIETSLGTLHKTILKEQ